LKSLRYYAALFTIAGLIVALDQWTKSLIRANVPFGGMWLPAGWEKLAPYARVVHWRNTGAAFGMFKEGALIFTVLAFIVIAAILWFYRQVEAQDWYLRLALAMQLAGAIGNLIDRLRFDGVVTDWVSIGNFAVFNVADASITVGTGIMLLGVWIMERRDEQAREENASQAEEEDEAHLGTGESVR
jgi:signal peptidase II